jgi:hypothetical protein
MSVDFPTQEEFVIPSERPEYRAYKLTKIEPEVEKPKRVLSKETRKRISDARKKRKKQPREGQSKKSMSLYSELLKSYGKNKDAAEWIKSHKSEMDGTGYNLDANGEEVSNPAHIQAKEMGITTEYSSMYVDFYEYFLDSVLFGGSVFDEHEPILQADDEMFNKVFGEHANEQELIDDLRREIENGI